MNKVWHLCLIIFFTNTNFTMILVVSQFFCKMSHLFLKLFFFNFAQVISCDKCHQIWQSTFLFCFFLFNLLHKHWSELILRGFCGSFFVFLYKKWIIFLWWFVWINLCGILSCSRIFHSFFMLLLNGICKSSPFSPSLNFLDQTLFLRWKLSIPFSVLFIGWNFISFETLHFLFLIFLSLLEILLTVWLFISLFFIFLFFSITKSSFTNNAGIRL